MVTIRGQLDRYVREKYRIDPELLPFSHENYAKGTHRTDGSLDGQGREQSNRSESDPG